MNVLFILKYITKSVYWFVLKDEYKNSLNNHVLLSIWLSKLRQLPITDRRKCWEDVRPSLCSAVHRYSPPSGSLCTFSRKIVPLGNTRCLLLTGSLLPSTRHTHRNNHNYHRHAFIIFVSVRQPLLFSWSRILRRIIQMGASVGIDVALSPYKADHSSMRVVFRVQ